MFPSILYFILNILGKLKKKPLLKINVHRLIEFVDK